jgi:hypothetical protein
VVGIIIICAVVAPVDHCRLPPKQPFATRVILLPITTDTLGSAVTVTLGCGITVAVPTAVAVEPVLVVHVAV